MTGDLLSPAQARARLGVSRTLFDAKFRPQLTEHRFGPRTVRFSALELAALVAETTAPKEEDQEAGMFGRRTVRDALEQAWRVKWKHAKGARKKAQLKKVVDAEIGAVPLSQWDYSRAEEWVAELRDRDLAVATIKSRVSCANFALELAAKRGWMKALPAWPEIEDPKNKKLRWLSDAEEKRLLEACGCQRRYVIADVMRDAIIVMIDTGARIGELVKVRDDSLFLRGQMACVEFLDRKGSDDLRVPLTKRADESLRRLLANRYWQKRVRGARESAKRANSAQNWITHRFEEIRDAAKLPGVTSHTLRHTFGSRLVQRGVSIYVVQKLMGHSDIRQTERYAHLAPSNIDKAILVLEPALPDGVAHLDDYRK